jgi:hypothetical protein
MTSRATPRHKTHRQAVARGVLAVYVRTWNSVIRPIEPENATMDKRNTTTTTTRTTLGDDMSTSNTRTLTTDLAYRSMRDALDTLRLTHSDIHSAPGATWYADENMMLARVCIETRTDLFRGACYIGASSINTGPEHGRRWVYARLRGDYSIGHVPAAVSAWGRVTMSATWTDAREALTVATSKARKVKNFACNVLTGGEPCEHSVPCATMDRHMLRLATYDNVAAFTTKKVPEGATYDLIADALRRLADEVNMTPANLQAILWVALADRNKSLRSIIAVNGTWSSI